MEKMDYDEFIIKMEERNVEKSISKRDLLEFARSHNNCDSVSDRQTMVMFGFMAVAFVAGLILGGL